MQKIQISNTQNIEITVLRTDVLHVDIQGNKFYKLKYNLQEASRQNCTTLLTFGGAFSNHIFATAQAGKQFDFKTIGIIRGEKPAHFSYTLREAEKLGMQLYFVNREDFRAIRNADFCPKKMGVILQEYGLSLDNKMYILPEGGTNNLAIKGTTEILKAANCNFDTVCLPVGTGGTLAGIISSLHGEKKVMGFSSLKGNFLEKEVADLLQNYQGKRFDNWEINTDYHFGGYGKVKPQLIDFINQFYQDYQIPLCPIYTGKMMFGLVEMIQNGSFEENSKILVIHTGGLQGITGFNEINVGKYVLNLD